MSNTHTTNTTSNTFFGSQGIDQAVAGFCAGGVTTIILHPLDLVKTQLQADTTRRAVFKPLSSIRALVQIARRHGIRGLYMGVTPNFSGATISWGSYFYWYDLLKSRKYRNNKQHALANEDTKLSRTQHLVAAAEAGAITSFFTNPIWLVKTRMCLQSPDNPQYRGLTHALWTIARQDGIRGLYRGFTMQIIGVTHGAIQFTVYEDMKKYSLAYHERYSSDQSWSIVGGQTTEYMLMGLASKIIATCTTYPYQLIKTRLQVMPTEPDSTYASIWDVVQKTMHREGASGFYKGMGTSILRVLPGTAITFVVYETLSGFFKGKNPSQQKQL